MTSIPVLGLTSTRYHVYFCVYANFIFQLFHCYSCFAFTVSTHLKLKSLIVSPMFVHRPTIYTILLDLFRQKALLFAQTQKK